MRNAKDRIIEEKLWKMDIIQGYQVFIKSWFYFFFFLSLRMIVYQKRER